MGKLCIAFFFTLLVFQCGCWYSPWESMEYELIGTKHRCHQDIINAVVLSRDKQASVNGVMCSVMLEGSGRYMERKPPYTLWLLAACSVERSTEDLLIQSVSIVRKGVVIWSREGLVLKLINKELIDNSKEVFFGEKKVLLPNVLNPKDGNDIRVVVKTYCENSQSEVLTFDFHPKITKGNWNTID